MRFRSIVTAGLYASLVPILGATGTWTGSMSAAPIAELQAPAAETTTDVPVHGGRLERRSAAQGLKPASMPSSAPTGPGLDRVERARRVAPER